MIGSSLRHALRSLRSRPRLALAAVACLAIGLAATQAVFTLVNAVLLRPLPFPGADRLVRVWLAEDGGDPRGSFSIPELGEMETGVRAFDAFLGTARVRLVALFDHGAERMRGEAVTRDYFSGLGLHPRAGRFFAAADFANDAPRVVVLSHRTWTDRYGADPEAVGRTFRTETTAFTVVGVAPPGFQGTVEDDVVEFWIPLPQYLPANLLADRKVRMAWAIGRVRPGRGPAAVEAELKALFAVLAQDHPEAYRRLRPRIEAMGENWRTGLRGGSALVLGAAGVLLVIAALNVGGLLFARTLERRRELAVRSALGASRRRIMLQLFLEAALLVAAGGGLGCLLAPSLLEAFLAGAPVPLPSYVVVAADARLRALVLVVLGVTAVLTGVAPAALASRVGPADALRIGGRGAVGGAPERRGAGALVAAEVALTLVLLVGGSLLLRSYACLAGLPLGFRTEGIVRMALTLSQRDVPDGSLPAFYDRLRGELAAEPGVERVGLVAPTLPPWDPARVRVRFHGMPESQREDGLEVSVHVVDHELLPTLAVPLVAGRPLEPGDGPRTRVALVSRSLAERLGGAAAALGAEIRVPGDWGVSAGPVRVVGVVEDVAYDGVAEDTRRYIRYHDRADRRAARDDIYVSLAAFPVRRVSIAVATRLRDAAQLEPLRRKLAGLAPASAVHWTSTMRDELASEYASSRFHALLVNAFSVSALLLAGVGVFALLSNMVARREAEIGLRLALGASRGSVLGLVAAGGARPLVAGTAVGVAGALVVSRSAAALLYGVSPLDPVSFALGAGGLLLVAALAAVLPARRAASVDPMVALRAE
jgi:putative ABC transport system permease protein